MHTLPQNYKEFDDRRQGAFNVVRIAGMGGKFPLAGHFVSTLMCASAHFSYTDSNALMTCLLIAIYLYSCAQYILYERAWHRMQVCGSHKVDNTA